MNLPHNFVKTFSTTLDYMMWLNKSEVKIVSVVVFKDELVVTYTFR